MSNTSSAPTLTAPLRSPHYAIGAAYGVAAVAIWAGIIVATRLGVTTTLGPSDLAGLRYGVAGLVLLPIVLRRGLALDRLGVVGLIILATGAGAPYAFIFAEGERFAPAADGGVLTPSVMTLFVAALAAIILRERFRAIRLVGFGLIFSGAVSVLISNSNSTLGDASSRILGQLLLLLAGFMWASYTVAMRRARIDALHAAALVSVASLIFYVIPYLLIGGVSHLLSAPLGDVVFQGLFQGLVGTVASLFLFGRAIALLGAGGGAAFGALVPVMTAFLAIPLLGEIPEPLTWMGIVLASAGVYLASGGRLSWPRQ